MNRHARRRAEAQERRASRRAATSQAMARLILDSIPPTDDDAVQVGVVRPPNQIWDLKPVAVPPAFIREIILARPLTYQGFQMPFVRAAPMSDCSGWMVQFEGVAFVLKGNFVGDSDEYKEAMYALTFKNVVNAAPRSAKYSTLTKFQAEELECDDLPFGFLSAFHPDPQVDAVLRQFEDTAIRAFWAMTASADD